VADRWRQCAGFSVFFDVESPDLPGPGELHRRIRLYHEETAGEATFPGWRSAEWVNWMLGRLGSPKSPSDPTDAACSLVSMEIVDARLMADPVPGAGDDTVAVELRLSISGIADLNRTLTSKVVGVLFGCDLT
jgi:hypothetical protein